MEIWTCSKKKYVCTYHVKRMCSQEGNIDCFWLNSYKLFRHCWRQNDLIHLTGKGYLYVWMEFSDPTSRMSRTVQVSWNWLNLFINISKCKKWKYFFHLVELQYVSAYKIIFCIRLYYQAGQQVTLVPNIYWIQSCMTYSDISVCWKKSHIWILQLLISFILILF